MRALELVPSDDELPALMRWYGYRFTRTGVPAGAERVRMPEDEAAFARVGRTVGVRQRWSAGDVVERATAAVERLDPDAVLAAWVAGLSSAPRGRQSAISFGWARFLGEAPREVSGRPDCGLGAFVEVDVTENLLRLVLGWSWNEIPEHFLPDLEAAVAEGLPVPTADDRGRLESLVELIASMPTGTTPGELEKAVARARLIPGTDKWHRYGILIGLAEIGVLPNPALPPSWDRFVPRAEVHAVRVRGSARSDIPQPLAGWRGGVDEHRAAMLRAVL